MSVKELIEAYESKLDRLERALILYEQDRQFINCQLIDSQIIIVKQFLENLKEIK